MNAPLTPFERCLSDGADEKTVLAARELIRDRAEDEAREIDAELPRYISRLQWRGLTDASFRRQLAAYVRMTKSERAEALGPVAAHSFPWLDAEGA